MPVIETRALRKTYGTGESAVEALCGVDIAVQEGELLAVMGPSGSGKSTLLHLLGGIDAPSAGQVLVEGRDLAALDDAGRTVLRRSRIGFIFQAFNLLPMLTAVENVGVPLLLAGTRGPELRRRAEEALQRVGMAHRKDHVPGALSGGEQQRVAIARALVMNPAVVLADEPTGNLDTANGRQISQLLRSLVDRRQATIVMVTHDHGVAASASRIVRLRDGQVEHDSAQASEPSGPAAGDPRG